MSEQVTEEGGVLVQQGRQLEGVLGGDQLVEAHLSRRHVGPLPRAQTVLGVRPPLADALEDHPVRVAGRAPMALAPAATPSLQRPAARPALRRRGDAAAARMEIVKTTPVRLPSGLAGDVATLTSVSKRLVLGRPLSSARIENTLLPKWLALPVFCSDPLSSNAYATQEILLVLSLGGVALLHLAPWVGLAVVALLVIVVASYRQTCHAYPTGGGAYAVSRANLGRTASLTAASALLVDYVLTVAVSVVAGVANLVSAVPALAPHAVSLSVGLVLVLTLMNLRGVKESGAAFAVPTYGFVVSVFAMLAVGLTRTMLGDAPVATSAGYAVTAQTNVSGLL